VRVQCEAAFGHPGRELTPVPASTSDIVTDGTITVGDEVVELSCGGD
jgi:hypothetical protein